MRRHGAHGRESDRWVTPGVIVAAIGAGMVITLGTIGCVTYLAARGYDPAPIVDLVASVGTAVAAVLGVGLQLIQRKTVAKVERNTGVIAYGVARDAAVDVERLDPHPPTADMRAVQWGEGR